MSQEQTPDPIPRKYPPIYEKVVPIAIAILILIITGLLVFTVLVGLGVFGGT